MFLHPRDRSRICVHMQIIYWIIRDLYIHIDVHTSLDPKYSLNKIISMTTLCLINVTRNYCDVWTFFRLRSLLLCLRWQLWKSLKDQNIISLRTTLSFFIGVSLYVIYFLVCWLLNIDKSRKKNYVVTLLCCTLCVYVDNYSVIYMDRECRVFPNRDSHQRSCDKKLA